MMKSMPLVDVLMLRLCTLPFYASSPSSSPVRPFRSVQQRRQARRVSEEYHGLLVFGTENVVPEYRIIDYIHSMAVTTSHISGR